MIEFQVKTVDLRLSGTVHAHVNKHFASNFHSILKVNISNNLQRNNMTLQPVGTGIDKQSPPFGANVSTDTICSKLQTVFRE